MTTTTRATVTPIASAAAVSAANRHQRRALYASLYIAGLDLPRGPTRLVGGAVLTQTDQRTASALATLDVLQRGPLTATEVRTMARPAIQGVGQALADLVAARVARCSGDVYEVVDVPPMMPLPKAGRARRRARAVAVAL